MLFNRGEELQMFPTCSAALKLPEEGRDECSWEGRRRRALLLPLPKAMEGAGVPCPNPEVALGTLCSHGQEQTVPGPGRNERRGFTWDHGQREHGFHPLPVPRARCMATEPSLPPGSLSASPTHTGQQQQQHLPLTRAVL